MSIGKEIVDDFGERTGVVIEQSDILIQMINERFSESPAGTTRCKIWYISPKGKAFFYKEVPTEWSVDEVIGYTPRGKNQDMYCNIHEVIEVIKVEWKENVSCRKS
jgi:hypothetical protein